MSLQTIETDILILGSEALDSLPHCMRIKPILSFVSPSR